MTDIPADQPESLPEPTHQPDLPAPETPAVAEVSTLEQQSMAPLDNATSSELRIRLPVFEGPLDLLLYLIKKDELDIYDIPIERITRQYLDYLQFMKMLDLEVAGEFLVVASTLVYIKSRTLLPKDLQPPEEDAEEDDPRWDLIRQLVEYKKFKDAAWQLHMKQLEQEKTYQRGAEVIVPERAAGSAIVGDLGIFDLINAFQKVLARVNQSEDLKEIFEERFTVGDKINTIQQMMATRERIFFEDLFIDVASRTEIVVTFLALLELIRLKFLRVTQADPFAEIEIAHAIDSTPLFQKLAPGAENISAIYESAPAGTDEPERQPGPLAESHEVGEEDEIHEESEETEPGEENEDAGETEVTDESEPVAEATAAEESSEEVSEEVSEELTEELAAEPTEETPAEPDAEPVETEETPETILVPVEEEIPAEVPEEPIEEMVSEDTVPDDESATEPTPDESDDESTDVPESHDESTPPDSTRP